MVPSLLTKLRLANLVKYTPGNRHPAKNLSVRLFHSDKIITESSPNTRGTISQHSYTQITEKLEFIEPLNFPQVPMYRALNQNGELTMPLNELSNDLTDEKVLDLYKGMVMLNTMDKIMFESHRQGRISFYMTHFGEEAVQFGSAGALEPTDLVFAQYREAGILIYRKMPLKLLMAQCFGNKDDIGTKGRQMPIHYGSKERNYVTISSTLATQMPQAAGAAYALKRDNSGRVTVCFFGEGASSEGDAHAAMNFAATLNCPVIFVCRNNGYAISTPASEQYKGDGIVSRGLGYGMCSIRVDGNDLLAVYSAIKAARQICVDELRPVLVETITYRVGHHSTSDDASAYRSSNEVKEWNNVGNPILRVFKYLTANNLWDDKRDSAYREEIRSQVLQNLDEAGKTKRHPIDSMFDDVYDKIPPHIMKQREELREHLKSYGDKYPIDAHEV